MLDMRTLQGFEARRPLALPLLGSRAVAGFPSPADDHMERRLDLNEHLVGVFLDDPIKLGIALASPDFRHEGFHLTA